MDEGEVKYVLVDRNLGAGTMVVLWTERKHRVKSHEVLCHGVGTCCIS